MSSMAAATPTGSVATPVSLRGYGDIEQFVVPWSAAGSASYDTGGSVWTPPSGLPSNWTLRQLVLSTRIAGGYTFGWNGSGSAPKILTYTGTQSVGRNMVTAPAVGTAGNDLTTQAFIAPFAGTVTGVWYDPSSTFTGAATNARNWALNNYTQTLVPATFTGTGSGAAYNLTTGVANAFTLGNAANVVVAKNDVLQFVSTHTGTGLADPGGLVIAEFTPTVATEQSEAPSTTNLSSLTIYGLALYGS